MPGWRLPARIASKPFKLTALGLSLAPALTLGLVRSGVLSPGGRPAGPVAPPVLAGHAPVRTPQQLSGTAAGRAHLVPASVTAARVPPPPQEGSRGTANPPRPPKGTLPPQRFNVPRSSARTAPRRPKTPAGPPGRRLRPAPPRPKIKITGYNAATSRPLPASAGRAVARGFQNAHGPPPPRVYQMPVNYQEPDGTWAPISTSLVRSGGTWREAADSVTEQFAPAGTAADLAQLGFGGGRQVGFGVAGASPVTAAVSGSTITYPDIAPGADLVLTALPGGGAKVQIILRSAQAPATWVFPLDLHGLTPRLDASGRVLFTDAAGNVVAWIPHAFMTDANIGAHSGIGAYSAGVTYQLQQAPGGGWALQMSINPKWLDDPAWVFPVTVDPTALWNYADSLDTFVQTGYSTSNYTSDELRVGTYDGGSDIAATYLDFSALSSELSHDTIYGATLYLDEIWSWSCTAEPVDVYKVTQSWQAFGIANYPGPSYDSTALGSASFAAGYTSCPNPAWEHIDLGSAGTSLVQGWANGGSNYGLTVRAGSTTNDYYWKKFDSDNAASGLNAPYLAVTYSPYNADYAFTSSPPVVSPAVTNNTAGYVDVNVTTEGHDTWTPTNGYKLQYEV